MNSKTNLTAIRNIAKKLLNLNVVHYPDVPPELIVEHPYLTNIFIYQDDKLVNILEEPEALLKYKKDMENIIDESDFAKNCILIKKPYRLLYFKLCIPYLDNDDFSSTLGDLWISDENGSKNVNCSKQELLKWFKKADKKILMLEDEYKHYKSTPDKICLYRGVSCYGVKEGISWTADLDMAKWFANRFSDDGKVFKTYVSKDDIICYFSRRGEDEYIIDPEKIKILSL